MLGSIWKTHSYLLYLGIGSGQPSPIQWVYDFRINEQHYQSNQPWDLNMCACQAVYFSQQWHDKLYDANGVGHGEMKLWKLRTATKYPKNLDSVQHIPLCRHRDSNTGSHRDSQLSYRDFSLILIKHNTDINIGAKYFFKVLV